jgi:uncharacterized protein (TIGR03067 family)
MKTNKIKSAAIALLAAALAAGAPVLGGAGLDEKDKLSDKEKLQGTWLAVSGERQGEKLNEDQLKIWEKLIFAEDKWTREGAERKEGTYTLGPDVQPKEIDLTVNGITWLGIYELKGNRLKLALKGERPPAFDSNDGWLLVFEKQK